MSGQADEGSEAPWMSLLDSAGLNTLVHVFLEVWDMFMGTSVGDLLIAGIMK